jgi:hypothetical protein
MDLFPQPVLLKWQEALKNKALGSVQLRQTGLGRQPFFRPESFEHALIQDSPGIGVRLGQVSSKSWPFLAISAPPRPRTNTCLLPSGTKPKDARRGDGTAVAMGHSSSNAPLPPLCAHPLWSCFALLCLHLYLHGGLESAVLAIFCRGGGGSLSSGAGYVSHGGLEIQAQ